MEITGRNRTPDKLPASEREPLFAACDRALRRTVDCLQPEYVIGIGAFAESRARASLNGSDVAIHRILHPSPASPLANNDWAGTVTRQLDEIGVRLPTVRA
jgi:single-strand selective monofunctional uracil DNA glycosylase